MLSINKIFKAFRLIVKHRGVRHTINLFVTELVSNIFNVLISKEKRELIYWEKQILGVGDFSDTIKKDFLIKSSI